MESGKIVTKDRAIAFGLGAVTMWGLSKAFRFVRFAWAASKDGVAIEVSRDTRHVA
jgi:hypothetical protein